VKKMSETRLINVGVVPTISNKKLVVGDRIVYNYGFVYRVVGVRKRTSKSRVLILKAESSGKVYDSRFFDKGFSPVVDEHNKYVRVRS